MKGNPLFVLDQPPDVDGLDDAGYSAFVRQLQMETAEEFRAVRGDVAGERAALVCYMARGERANLTAAELIDFLCVDTPCTLDQAGYTDQEIQTVAESMATVTAREISTALPPLETQEPPSQDGE